MAELSGFFDAHVSTDADGNAVYDRAYLAESFARYFASFIGNGVFGGKANELMVNQKETADMSVKVLTGQAFINGYFYENTDELSLEIDNADGVLDRIDLIVLRWSKNDRVIRLAVEKGSSASSPVAPQLKRNDDYYELELAQVYIKAGATRITQVNITDTRLDSTVCGFVVGVVKQFDTTEFNAQLNAWIEMFKLESVEEVRELSSLLEAVISAGDIGPLVTDIQKLKDTKVNKSGDTMTDNLGVSKHSAPTFALYETSANSTAHFQLWNHLLFIANRPTADNSNYRSFYISDHIVQDDVADALKLLDVRDGVSKTYNILHAGNLSAFGLSAVPASVE